VTAPAAEVDWSGASPEAMTTWRNPTERPARLKLTRPAHIVRTARDPATDELRTWVVDHEEIEVVIAPGASRALPTKYDNAIHLVTGCSHPGCVMRGAAGRCKSPATAGPSAFVMGGLAPLLIREGQEYGLHPSLVPVAPPPPRPMLRPGQAGSTSAAPPETEDPAMARARARARNGGGR